MTARTTNAHRLSTILEIPMTISVGVGSLALSEAKSFENTGTMKMSSARKMTVMTDSTTAG